MGSKSRNLRSKFGLSGLALAAVAVTAVFAGCNSGGGSSGGDGSNSTDTPTNSADAGGESEIKAVVVGFTPTIVLPQALLGVEGGEYAKLIKGVEFSGAAYKAGSGVIEALRAGTIHIGGSGPYPAAQAFAKAQDIVLLTNSANGGTEIMVSKTSNIKSVSDLKGKTVGVNQLGSTVDAMVRYNLIKAKLIPDTDVKILAIEPVEQAEALKKGEVAAVAAPAPWASYTAINGNGRPLLDWKAILDDGKYSAGSLYTTKKFAEANPNFIKKFIAANDALTKQLNDDRVKGDAAVLAAWSKMSKKELKPDVAKAAFATIEYSNVIDLPGIQRFCDIAFEARIAKKKADLNGFVWKP